jgi:hypothetical protein
MNIPYYLKQLLSSYSHCHTSQQDAWVGGNYETFTLKYDIPAARIREFRKRRREYWFDVADNDISMRNYKDKYALLHPYKRPQLDKYILPQGLKVNVGKAKKHGSYDGGGWQFEVVENVSNTHPFLYERVDNPKKVKF